MSLKKLILEESLKESKTLVVVSRTLGATFPEPSEGWDDPSGIYQTAEGLYLVNLVLSYKYKYPLYIDEKGIRTTLTFGDSIGEVSCPWESVIVIRSLSDVPSTHMWAVEKPIDEPVVKPRLQLVH